MVEGKVRVTARATIRVRVTVRVIGRVGLGSQYDSRMLVPCRGCDTNG